jgi:hypothetical protein
MSFGTFGSVPDDVSATDFYSWFQFGEVTRTSAERGAVLVTHRTAGQFRDLVVLRVTADAHGQTVRLSLQVARSFIHDPREGMFARDVVASFIREASAQQGYDECFAVLLGDLWSKPLRGPDAVVYTDCNPLPSMPRLPGDFRPAFPVYGGAEATFTTPLTQTDFCMSNDHFDGVGALTVSFRRQS